MYELPTTSGRGYRGKYPNRVASLSYARSPCQMAIARFLEIKAPVHLELNCGRRFIACTTEIKMDEPILTRDISHVTVKGVTPIQLLSQSRYDEMMGLIRAVRSKDASNEG